MGINFNSKYRSGKMISMSQRFRYKDSRERYPGPGSYIRFSEFGILVSKKARNNKEESKTMLIIKSLKLKLMKHMVMWKQPKMKLPNL